MHRKSTHVFHSGLDLDQEHFLVILAMTHVLLDRGVVLLHPDLLDLHAEVAGRHPNGTITTAVAILVAIVTATAEPLLLPVTCVENRGHGRNYCLQYLCAIMCVED